MENHPTCPRNLQEVSHTKLDKLLVDALKSQKLQNRIQVENPSCSPQLNIGISCQQKRKEKDLRKFKTGLRKWTTEVIPIH